MVNWADIVSECGNYKAGFVAVFRKYEGQPTDERDGSNRIVTVTMATFADHVGVPRETFRRWVKLEVNPELGSTLAKQERTAVSHANVVKNMAAKDAGRWLMR